MKKKVKKIPPAIRVSVDSLAATIKYPFTMTVVRGKTVHNVALPRIQSHQGKEFQYWFASDTLCDEDRSAEQLSQPVQISIASSLPSLFNLRVKSVNNFIIGNKTFKSKGSPSEPRYYMYTFPDDVDKVDIRVTSPSEICGKIVARRVNCPLFDASGLLEQSETFFYQSFTTFAGFSLKKSVIGRQFHLAFTVHPDETLCGTPDNFFDIPNNPARIKLAVISVTPVKDNLWLPLFPILLYSISMSTVIMLTYLKYKWLDRRENNEPNILDGTDSEGNVLVDKIWLFDKPSMIVSHKEYQKLKLVKDSKYFNFLFFQIFGSILPSLTTLFDKQKTSNNLNFCYLNFLCSLEFLCFKSFNSMTSASSLAVIGVLNLIIVFREKIFSFKIPRLPTTHGLQQRDAPKVVCFLGLVSMGILWTITNNCPHRTTIHLDMYTSSWIFYAAFMWIYSKRHGVRKWQQFFIIAVSSIYGCLTLAENMFNVNSVSRWVVKILFSLTAISSTVYFCYQYFYERPSGLQGNQWITPPFESPQLYLSDANGIYNPLRSKVVLIVLLICLSVVCAILPLLTSESASNSAIICLGRGQIGIYLVYYAVQKCRFERQSFTLFYKICCTLIFIVFMLMECLNRYLANFMLTYNVLLTPAKSRQLNMDCVLPGIDLNDLRHYSCAVDCFLFICLMDFIDSNIKDVPKKHIFVF
ncbi:SID1 transmembrane family member 1 [Caenorhabditis elegans]|uniref:SID1 transmembrane family member 1 n=1 Tax=Caenorhabditis elegans TaxID=6239 RepID=D1MN44_CAEEL|nr:SID1 transmembrane family member 1 [Caenorhabditis elegans]CCD63619.1 SID1 transmembrane family member 1 [Caenorhabditis elegans]|eukprot:NP_001257283.1 Uncharacterized protein CELE_C08A9.3 [Caenorhabditis elegans]